MKTTGGKVMLAMGIGIVLGVIAGLISGAMNWPSWIPGAVVGGLVPIVYFAIQRGQSQ